MDEAQTDTVVHVVMPDGTEHWGSPFGVLADHLDQQPSQVQTSPSGTDQSEPAGELEPAADPSPSTDAEVTSDGAELPAQSDDHDAGTTEARPGDPQRVAWDTDGAAQPGVPGGAAGDGTAIAV
jgi:hypothetical protein